MKFIHPRKYWRLAIEQWRLWRFKREAQRCGVRMELGEGVVIKDCHVMGSKFGSKCSNEQEKILRIGDGCGLYGVVLMFHGYNNQIQIGNGTHVNATKDTNIVPCKCR